MKTAYKKESFPIIYGDIFSYTESLVEAGNNGSSVIIPHVCNNVNLFSAGFANAVAEKYPIVKENYHLLGASFLKTHLGYVQFVEVLNNKVFQHKLIIANMIAQNGTINKNNTRPLNYLALVKCMTDINRYIKQKLDNTVQIHAPKFGSGLAGGNWFFIEELMKDIWTNNNTYIHILK